VAAKINSTRRLQAVIVGVGGSGRISRKFDPPFVPVLRLSKKD